MRKLLPFLFFFFFACSAPDYSQIKVKEVIDGDTVILATGESLRYIGIDTPETWIRRGNEFVYDPEPFGQEATRFNRKLVEGKTVRVEFDVEKRDRYGRLLGYCFLDDFLVNEKLVKEGYALLYTFPPNLKYVDLLIEAQKYARQNKRGLWQAYQMISPGEALNHVGQVRTVQGVVLSTYQTDKIIFLNFGRNYRQDFTALIFRNVADFFKEKGIKPAEYYRGKTVEVTGVINQREGPEIVINSPQEIRVID